MMIRKIFLLAGVLFATCFVKAQEVDSSRIVRVLTYNILHGATTKGDFDLDLIARVIKSTNPDLVALQEVDYKTNRAKKYDLVTELAIRTDMSPLFARAMPYDGGEYGEGILSKYSFLSTRNHPLPYTEGKEPRAAAEVNVILKSGDTIRFIGTHLDHTKDPANRQMQAKELNRVFTADEEPAILTGDLNSQPYQPAMTELFKAWQQSFSNDEPTYPSDDPSKKIDYVLFRPAHRWRVLETKVIDEKVASDHCPVLVVLELLPNH